MYFEKVKEALSVQYLPITNFLECCSELSGHCTIDNKIDAAVEESHHIHEVA